MKKKFSKSWIRSKQPRKQRKYRYNAPLHIRGKFLHCHLSKELRKKYGKRALRLRKGDKVKIVRGEFKGTVAKVSRVDLKRMKVYLENVMRERRDGRKVAVPFDASNLMITELNLEDKMRMKQIERS
ncbi:50S ribosomal protein L24 [Candidatus Woesearchaeota archaeon]|nr:MAG: 50S ribosomal protein L24 [Candidatus Woesearchaeota archaeon]